MVKTTIMLDDQLYRQLVNEAVERYGSTRKLSLLINNKLKSARLPKKPTGNKIIMIRLGRKLGEKELQKAIEKGRGEAVKWSV
jgi:hypothetical protein